MFKDKKKYILSLIFSLVTYFSLCLQGVIQTYNVMSAGIFLIIMYYYMRIDLYPRKYLRCIFVMSVVFSFLYVIGDTLYKMMYSPTISFWMEFCSLRSLCYLVGNFFVVYGILAFLVPRLININLRFRGEKFNKIKSFWKYFFIMLVFYLPYFIIYFPGVLTNDSISEMGMVLGNVSLSNHHTVIHYLFIKIFYSLGYFIFHDVNLAVSVVSFMQMVIMILIFSYVVLFLKERGVNKKILWCVFMFYSLIPIFPIYSITMWKDILFGGFSLLVIIECMKILEKHSDVTIKCSWKFIIFSILVLLFRNNALYAYLIVFLLMVFVFKRNIKIILGIFLIIFSTYFLITGPIYYYCHIEKSSSSEYIAIPLQQVGRMAYKDVSFNKKEKNLINKLIPIDVLKKSYNPIVVDDIKFNEFYHQDVFENNKGDYFKLWMKLCISHFDVITESYLISTLGYWYPGVNYWTIADEGVNNQFGIYQFMPKSIRNICSKVFSKGIPIIGLFSSIGFCFWIIIFSIIMTLKKRGLRHLVVYGLIIGIWFTMMVAAPVFSEYRYVYSFLTTLPLLVLYPYFPQINNT